MNDECIARVQALSKTLSKARAKEFLQYATDAVDAARRTGTAFDEQAAVDEAARQFFQRMVRQAEMQKWHAALNYRVRAGFVQAIDRMPEKEIADYAEHLLIPKDGRSNFKGAVEMKSITLHHAALTHFANGIERRGVDRGDAVRYLRKSENAQNIVRASYDVDKRLTDIPAEARAIAEAMEDTADYMRRLANRYGADIAKLPGYLFRQSHDAYKIRRAGREQWAEFYVDLLDEQRTFGGNLTRAQKIERLKNSWETIVDGKNRAEMVKDLSQPPGFKGPGNMAKELSHSRNLHFKDGDAAWKYMQAYGYPDVGTAFVGGLEMMSRNIAAMMHLGPNPKYMLLELADIASNRIRSNDATIGTIDKQRLELEFDEVMGSNSLLPTDNFGGKLARAANWIRNVSSSAVLGGVSITSLSDVATATARLQEFGLPLAEAHRSMIAGMFEGRRAGEMRDIADSLNIGLEYLMDSVAGRFLGDGAGNGQGSHLVSTVFRFTGMNWLSDTMKASAGLTMSNYLAKMTAKSFDSLTPAARQELNAYGITADSWPALKDAVREVNGKKYIDASNIVDSDLQLTFQTFITGFVNSAVLTPGARARLTMRAGKERGTVLSEMAMFFFHLKSYSITYGREILSRAVVGGGSGSEKFIYGAHLISSMIVYGTLVNMLKDVSKGRQPQEIDGAALFRGLMTSGGLGFYGDLLNAMIFEEKKFGKGPATEILGPVYGTFDKLIVDPLYNAAHGEFDRIPGNLYRGAKSMLPFANLFYARLGLDYFIFWEMNEALRPGWASDFEDRVREEYGQEFFPGISPTESVYGGLLN